MAVWCGGEAAAPHRHVSPSRREGAGGGASKTKQERYIQAFRGFVPAGLWGGRQAHAHQRKVCALIKHSFLAVFCQRSWQKQREK